MIKQIAPGIAPVIEHYCDHCYNLIAVEGREQITEHTLTMYLSAEFGANSHRNGLYFTKVLCEECAFKALLAIEAVLETEFKTE